MTAHSAVGLAPIFHVTTKLVCFIGSFVPLWLFSRNKLVCRGVRYYLYFFASKMPKRTCPFPETFSSQYKIHIGQQELNTYGVFGSKYRQEIYGTSSTLVLACVAM